jgi:ABC-type siderophore export system fused ATPase/permease subunit
VDGEGRLVYLDERDVEVLREWAVDQGRISKTDLWEEAVRRFT